MLLIIVVVGMIVIFPWIKLYQMGSKDRLTLADGASTILVSMILMSLLFLCLFKYNKFIRIGASPDSKRTVASQINKNFYNETRRRYEFLKHYDSLRNRHNIQSDIVNFKKESIAYRDNSKVGTNTKSGIKIKSLQDSLKNWNDVADIKQLYWLDSTGQEKYNWTEEANNAPHSNFISRNYFKSIKENNTYYLDGDSTRKYFLDQVISWTTGVFTSIISIRSKGLDVYVAASSFSMSSVDNTLLPAGYSFAIIDNNGKVLYHSMKARNLNENVKSEFYDSASITSCINFRLENEFITDYYSKTYSVLVTPMENLPYNIIIFSDKSFQETRDIEVYSFTFSMLLVLFVYIVLQLGITFLVSSRRSFFKKQLFDTSWIGPKDFRHKEYLLSSALNMLIIIMLIFFFPRTTFLQFLFLLLFAIIFISLFFNRLLAKRYLRINKINNYRYKMYAVKLLLILLVIHYFIASCVMLNSQCKVIILSTIHPINFLDSLNENNISNKRTDVSDKKNEASEKSGHDLERWHVLLGHYRIAIMPITEQADNHKDLSNQLLRSETNYTHFLHDMQNVTLKIAHDIKVRNSDKKTDELALKLQITAHYFYMYIWQSLTKEEKFLLYDLAEDNLVNSYDDYNLTILIAKGVIINANGSPHLFNRGFRNFILTAIGSTEAMKIKDRIKENGNWGNLRTPLIIVILALLAFLLISQQEAYSKLLTYVAALSAGIPLVLKILSLFDKNASKTGS